MVWIKNMWFWLSVAEESTVMNNLLLPLKRNLCFTGTIYSSFLSEKSPVMKKRPALLSWILLRLFPRGQHTEAVVQREPRLFLRLLMLATFNNFPASTGCEGKKELWRPRKATDKDVDWVAMEATGLKGSWREVEACHYAVGSESLKRVQKRLLVNGLAQLQKSYQVFYQLPKFWRFHYMGWPPRTGATLK